MRAMGRAWWWFSTAFTALFLLVTCTPLVGWYGTQLAGAWTDPEGETLIVLAGGDLDRGFPSENTMLRCLYGVRAYQAGRFKKVVVAGFQTSVYMRELLRASGVSDDAIVVEDASRSTRENAVNVARLLADDRTSKVLLTSEYHMFRAWRVFRKAGLSTLPRPIPDARKRARYPLKRWSVFQDEVVESLKIAYYGVRGWL